MNAMSDQTFLTAHVLDEDMIDELLMLGPEMTIELLELFVVDGGRQLVAMRSAVDRGDEDAWRRAAHQFKGASGAIGANRAMAIARLIETCDAMNLHDLFALLTCEMERARRAIEKRVQVLAEDGLTTMRCGSRAAS